MIDQRRRTSTGRRMFMNLIRLVVVTTLATAAIGHSPADDDSYQSESTGPQPDAETFEDDWDNFVARLNGLDDDATTLPGRYDYGDGLGVNDYLNVRSDGSFERTAIGCLGLYGTSRGLWTKKDDLVLFWPRQSTGVLGTSRPSRMLIRKLRDAVFLLPQYYLKDFDDRVKDAGTASAFGFYTYRPKPMNANAASAPGNPLNGLPI